MADVRELRFDVNLEQSDYRAVVFYNVLGKNRFSLVGMSIVSVACVIYLAAGLAGMVELTRIMTLLCVAFILIILGLATFIRKITKKLMNSDSSFLGSKRRMVVGEDGVYSESEEIEEPAQFRWDELYNGEEIKGHFIMFSKSGMILIFPKTSMKEAEVPQLRKIFKVMMQSNFKTKY